MDRPATALPAQVVLHLLPTTAAAIETLVPVLMTTRVLAVSVGLVRSLAAQRFDACDVAPRWVSPGVATAIAAKKEQGGDHCGGDEAPGRRLGGSSYDGMGQDGYLRWQQSELRRRTRFRL